MKVHYIQHVPFESLGYIETWLTENNHTIISTKVWENAIFPSTDDFDVLIIMGGPMSVNDDHKHTWLVDEKDFIFNAIRAGKKIIGICLGAQLLAVVSGAAVSTNKYKEIGWFPVKIEPSFAKWLGKEIEPEVTVFHWHGDMFDIPPGGINHASSLACSHQLFTCGDNIIGLQFHPEATPASIALMIEHGKDELTEGDFIQSAEVIKHEAKAFTKAQKLMKNILEKLLTEKNTN